MQSRWCKGLFPPAPLVIRFSTNVFHVMQYTVPDAVLQDVGKGREEERKKRFHPIQAPEAEENWSNLQSGGHRPFCRTVDEGLGRRGSCKSFCQSVSNKAGAGCMGEVSNPNAYEAGR